ncbi:hypothetical protein MLD38_000971 [Melastoma candidum]|uniref:Uncharacterized protein n=1 Tax=Melastoma candidum TaxID=119954 RepID=A0ACB9SBM9_9MYRT|nr:hypothetical protein MLD38_000971 [Melastoma candidum]
MDDYSISSFICRETQECLDDDRLDEVSLCDGLDDEYLRTMFEREIVCCSGSRKGGSLLADDEGMKCTRSDAVSWIIKSRDTFRFRFQTVYMSVMYFDRFLAKRSIDREKPWAMWLLTAACLSLAAKMEESTVPNLSSLQNQLEYYLSNQMIQRMELLVLHTLEWRLRLVTPFAFLNHFASMFRADHHRPSEITSRSVEIILAMARDISSPDRRPSTIAAAAAAAAASNDLQSKDDLYSKMKSSRFLGNLDIDGVFSCYSQMKRLGKQHRDDDDDDDDRSEEWTAPTAISLPMGQSKPVSVVLPEISAITCEDGNSSRRRPKRKSPSGDDDDDPHYRDSRDCS